MKLYFVWASSARTELRRIERETAMRILIALTRFAETGEGDVKALEGILPALIGYESAIGA